MSQQKQQQESKTEDNTVKIAIQEKAMEFEALCKNLKESGKNPVLIIIAGESMDNNEVALYASGIFGKGRSLKTLLRAALTKDEDVANIVVEGTKEFTFSSILDQLK